MLLPQVLIRFFPLRVTFLRVAYTKEITNKTASNDKFIYSIPFISQKMKTFSRKLRMTVFPYIDRKEHLSRAMGCPRMGGGRVTVQILFREIFLRFRGGAIIEFLGEGNNCSFWPLQKNLKYSGGRHLNSPGMESSRPHPQFNTGEALFEARSVASTCEKKVQLVLQQKRENGATWG